MGASQVQKADQLALLALSVALSTLSTQTIDVINFKSIDCRRFFDFIYL